MHLEILGFLTYFLTLFLKEKQKKKKSFKNKGQPQSSTAVISESSLGKTVETNRSRFALNGLSHSTSTDKFDMSARDEMLCISCIPVWLQNKLTKY